MKIKANDYYPNETFKFIRQGLGLTQKKLSEETKINKSSIEKYERGIDNYTFETLLKVAKKYNLEVIIQTKKK